MSLLLGGDTSLAVPEVSLLSWWVSLGTLFGLGVVGLRTGKLSHGLGSVCAGAARYRGLFVFTPWSWCLRDAWFPPPPEENIREGAVETLQN